MIRLGLFCTEDSPFMYKYMIYININSCKYMSRLGLFCTADSPLMDIAHDSDMVKQRRDLYTISDDGDEDGRLMLTDGAVINFLYILFLIIIHNVINTEYDKENLLKMY